MTLIVDLQRTHALGICCDCDGPTSVNQYGRCETCGSSSVIRAFSLAATMARERLALDPRFLRGARFVRANEEPRA